MKKPRKLYETLHNKFNETLGKRIISHQHRGRRVEKVYKAVHHLSNGWIHFGELCLAMVFMATTYLFGNGENLPNNTTLVYPLMKVSTLECRTQEFSTLSNSCITTLPVIHGADYVTYQNEKTYTDIYTVLRGASYTSGRDQAVGAHYGVDIASAQGTPLYAIADGEVYAAEYNSAYGNIVKIKFKYKGEILYAIYAHMHSYTVKAGDIIKKGQQIGKIGNTGNVRGALGGYHVHFEIDKDAGGRPAYVFTNCPEVSQGHYEIIQKGYCRVQLFQYTKDPIALLENAKATFPTQTPPPATDPSTNPPKEESGTNNNEHPASPEPVQPSLPIVPTPPSTPTVPVQPSLPTSSMLTLDTSKVDLIGKEFLNKRDLRIEKQFGEVVALDDSLTFTVYITRKGSDEPFHGTLNQPLLLIASNTNIHINPVSTVIVNQGKATITLTPQAKGNVYIALNLGTAKIGGLTVSIQ